MNKITFLAGIILALTPNLPVFSEVPYGILAQIRGEDSQEFFQEGNQEMNQDIQRLENQPTEDSSKNNQGQNLEPTVTNEGNSLPVTIEQPTETQKEQNLEQELNINQKEEKNEVEEGINGQVDQVSPNVEDVPDADQNIGVDDNLPQQPDEDETEIKL